MRKDVYVQNDSGGMSFLSSSVLERVIDDGRDNDQQFVDAHEVILGSLVGDDSFIARVVVGEPLTAAEQAQWIARYRWALKVPCGKLLVCGGFDPDVLGGFVEEGESDGVGAVEVPPGHYLADVYTYLHSMNGRVILEQEWGEKLGAWFRKDHPGRAFPSWVAGELAMFHEEDPGHEEAWDDLKASVESGALAVETEPLDWIGFLIHLQPFDPGAALTPPEEGAWFGAGQGLRKPAPFPLGVPAVDAQDPEYREALSDLVGGEEEEEASDDWNGPAVDVRSRAREHPLSSIAGGPVEISPRQLLDLFRLAWFATVHAHPELRVEAPNAANFARLVEGWKGVRAEVKDGALSIGWVEDGRPTGMLARLQDCAADTWTMFPEGSTLELSTIAPREEETPLVGLLRFRGSTRGRLDTCVWRLDQAFPAVSADTLREALALSAAAGDGLRLPLRSAEEAEAVLAAFMEEWGILIDADNPLTRAGAELRLVREEPLVLIYVAARAFKMRYASTWAMEPDEEDDEDED